jgi:hypothetical protein
MSCLRSSPFISAVLGGVFLFFLLAGQVQAAELRPYSPPIQQQAPAMEQQMRPVPRTVVPADPLETYYQKFERDAVKLTSPQKEQLIQAFSGQLDVARRSNQWDQVAHYARLIEILNLRR